MRVFRTVVCAVIAALAATAMAEEAKQGPKFEFHGFVGGSLFAQDAVFNTYGEGIFWVTKQPHQDKLVFGGDARQTRLNLSLAGPMVFGGAIPKAVAEVDFFSNLNVTNPGFSTTMGVNNIAPRLRLSYGELNWGSTIFRFGQDNDLIAGSFAVATVGHVPQPYTYGAGFLNVRHVMAEVYQTVPAGSMKAELAFQVMAPSGGSADGFNALSTAESSGIPGLSARARVFVPKVADVYVVGHWNRRDRNGQDNTTANVPGLGDKQDCVAGSVGIKFTPGPLTIQGQGYIGKNMTEYVGAIGNTLVAGKGDAHEYGAWGQVGLDLTPEFSAWAFVGTERFTNYNDAIATYGSNARLANVNFAGMLRYMQGGYALGLEYVHSHTTYASVQADSRLAAPNGVLDGNQLMLSGFYFF